MVLWTEQSAHGVEEEIREKAIPLDQDPGGESEPYRRNDRCSSQKFLHREKDKDFVDASSARRDGHLVVAFKQFATREFTKSSDRPSG